MKTLIVVPARYGSSRFPGKPLADLAGRSIVARVAIRAWGAAARLEDATAVVATDDPRIFDHCNDEGIDVVMTPMTLKCGSERALAAAESLKAEPELIVNLQADAPFTPVRYITSLIDNLSFDKEAHVATPVIRMTWSQLDEFRANKLSTPFTGTTCIVGGKHRAIWFSKNIIPAIRHESALRKAGPLSPVRRHVGLYAYRAETLREFVDAPPSHYELVEDLEQLRLLEIGRQIRCVEVEPTSYPLVSVDTPEDLERARAVIEEHGDPDTDFFAVG